MTAVKVFKIIISFLAVVFIAAFLFFSFIYLKPDFGGNFVSNDNFNVATSGTRILPAPSFKTSTSSVNEPVKTAKKPKELQIISKEIIPKPIVTELIKEVSSKSFEELINSSVIQLYCGYLNGEKTNYSDISRGSGVIITNRGEILTNRHIIYDENLKKAKSDCFVLKSPFPNIQSEKPKIYYTAKVMNYPLKEKFSEVFSKDKYYNDFAILKIDSRPTNNMKINQLLQTEYASEADYPVLENNGIFNYLPIDWNYRPQNDDLLITLGYGVDAGHVANQITSTIGRLAGNIDIRGDSKPQILLIESNATAGFSGGALINPRSKGLIGLISWITAGDVTGKFTVAIFRDFLAETMFADLNFSLK